MADCRSAVIIGGTTYKCLFHGEGGAHRFGLTLDDCPVPWCRSPKVHGGDHDVPEGPVAVCDRPARPDDLPHCRVTDSRGKAWHLLGEVVREPEGVGARG